jgi:AcrR family transcriptional regulator
MSGKSQYDESTVINAAVRVFWRHGFATASISDLTEATGLSRSSIYQRFGDKDGLFNESLERYVDRVITRMESTRQTSAKASMEALLRDFSLKAPTRRVHPGAYYPAVVLKRQICRPLRKRQ